MKKILCFFIGLVMILSTFAASAATTEVGAAIDSDWYNVYIAGQADKSTLGVTVLLLDKDDSNNVGYIAELDTDSFGNYETKFKFAGNINDYTVKVRDNDTAEDLTHSLNTAFARHEIYCIDILLTEAGNDVISFISEGGLTNVVAKLNNKYGNNASVSVMIAAYDENNKLLATDIKSLAVGYNDLGVTKSVDFSDVALPDETKKVKAFAWEDTVDLIPLAEQDEKAIGTSLAFSNENSDETKVIGVIGDSITHWGHYFAFLNEYYATRYPNANIVLLNKGLSGDSASGVISRLDWDVFNESNSLYGACDEITLMIGMNDSGYGSYTFGKMPDDEYYDFYSGGPYPDGKYHGNMQSRVNTCVDNIETIIEYCQENNKGITLVTPSLYDESDRFVNSLPPIKYGTNYALGKIAEGIIDLGEEYNVPVLDLYKASNEYSDRIRAEYPEATIVITNVDGIHPLEKGGYLFGYLFARAQETNDTVASVEINASNGANKVDNATVSDVTVDTSNVSYTYLANAIPLYTGSSGYKYVKGYGVDITNTMNREIIKVTNLDDGEYTISFDGAAIGTFTDEQLAAGVNIAELENNPGQKQAKEVFALKDTRLNTEQNLRGVVNTQMSIRNGATDRNSATYKYYPHELGYDFDSFTTEKWIEVATQLKANYISDGISESDANSKNYNIGNYIKTHKNKENDYINTIKDCITTVKSAAKPVSHTVVISK